MKRPWAVPVRGTDTLPAGSAKFSRDAESHILPGTLSSKQGPRKAGVGRAQRSSRVSSVAGRGRVRLGSVAPRSSWSPASCVVRRDLPVLPAFVHSGLGVHYTKAAQQRWSEVTSGQAWLAARLIAGMQPRTGLLFLIPTGVQLSLGLPGRRCRGEIRCRRPTGQLALRGQPEWEGRDAELASVRERGTRTAS